MWVAGKGGDEPSAIVSPKKPTTTNQEGARTSGVTDLVVVVQVTEPCGYDITSIDNVRTPRRFRKAALFRRHHRPRALLLDAIDQDRDHGGRDHEAERDDGGRAEDEPEAPAPMQKGDC
jgi:hypothetical protein